MATSGRDSTSPDEVPVQVPRAPIALSTASVYPQTCADGFALAADLGYDGLEVMVWTDPVSQDRATLAGLVEHYQIPVLSIHAPTLLVTQRVWGREPWAKLHRSCELAVALGARTVVVHPPFRWQREYAAGFVAGMERLADEYGVRLAVENMYPWRARGRELLAYAPGWDPLPHPYRDVTLDLSHTATAGIDGLVMARALGDRLTHLHLADGEGSAKDEHLVPGEGSQPCDEVLGLLAERNWSGTVVVEVNTRRARTRAERASDLAESLAFARLHLASRVPAGDAGGRV
jgi:sugar phosphate isomerase/epimerase